jgi:hypothetical protein
MLHPVKAATSFECDGCNHHASFHSLENKEEDAILKKWEEQSQQESREQQRLLEYGGAAAKKRKRVKEKAEEEDVRITEVVEVEEGRQQGMLERTMALFGGGTPVSAGADDESLVEELPAMPVRTQRARRGKKGVD